MPNVMIQMVYPHNHIQSAHLASSASHLLLHAVISFKTTHKVLLSTHYIVPLTESFVGK